MLRYFIKIEIQIKIIVKVNNMRLRSLTICVLYDLLQ